MWVHNNPVSNDLSFGRESLINTFILHTYGPHGVAAPCGHPFYQNVLRFEQK